jgi:5'-nucleotidase
VDAAGMKQESTLFLDLDGVMADFDGTFPKKFGVSHIDMPKKEMWRHIKSVPDFFLELPPMEGAIQFFNRIEGLNPIILTACPSSWYDEVARQKREWVRNWLGRHIRVLPVNGSESKPLFMHAPGDILIDDWGKNVEAWRKAGGRAIHHRDFKVTHAELSRFLKDVSHVPYSPSLAYG